MLIHERKIMISATLQQRYRIEAELGQGGMGLVYRAHDLRLNRPVAVKVLSRSNLDTQGRARLLAEAQAAASLNHANIVTVHDADEADGQPFIVMELIEGQSLRALLQDINENRAPSARAQDEDQTRWALQMARQVCLALEVAHAAGIIHRDIKPENVLVTRNGTAKLMDFGLAHSSYRQGPAQTEQGVIVGTVAYLAPELLQGQPPSPQSDLYALGILLYELLTGAQPFQGDMIALMSQHMYSIPYPPSHHHPEVSPEIDDLVLRLLAKTPADRPESAAAAGRALDRLLGVASGPTTSSLTYLRSPGLVQAPRHNLPASLGHFIGREKELDELKRLLAGERLVTLTGSGGVGKTRLALQAAEALLPDFRDGVWLVALAALTDPNLVCRTLAVALGAPFDPNTVDASQTLESAIADHVRSKHMLVLLDNCEHLIEAAARQAEHLLRSGLDVQVLASSREALGLPGERVYQVPSLSLPTDLEHAAAAEAVQLFLDRAAAVRPGFALTAQNTPAVSAIVQRLDGIPLAIELAAARTKTLAPEQLAARLDDRFRLLTGGSRTALPRQQTLRATIDWSYSLLTADEKTLFARLAVFLGGWSLDAAEMVCADEPEVAGGLPVDQVFDLLESLVNKSLVLTEETYEGEAPPAGNGVAVMRYKMLETVRQYAREKLFESQAPGTWRDRHLAYFTAFAEATTPGLRGPGQLVALQRLDREIENIHQALDWAVSAAGPGNPAAGPSPEALLGLRLLGAMWFYVVIRQQVADFKPAFQALWQAAPLSLELLHDQPALTADLPGLPWYGYLPGGRDLMASSARQVLEMVQPLADELLLAQALFTAGIAGSEGESAAKTDSPALLQARDIFTRLGETWWAGRTNYALSAYQSQRGQVEQARQVMQLALAQIRQCGDSRSLGLGLMRLGILTSQAGDTRRALSLTHEAQGILRRMGLHMETTECALFSAQYNLQLGRYPEARQSLEEATPWAEKFRSYFLTWCLDNWSEYYFSQGDAANCLEYGRRGLEARRTLGEYDGEFAEETAFAYFGLVQRLARLGEASQARALWDEQPAVASYGAYYLTNRAASEGMLAAAEQRGPQAVAALQEALRLTRDLSDVNYISYLVESLAQALLLDNQPEQAARIWSAARAVRQPAGMVIWPGDQAWFDHLQAGLIAALGRDGFAAAWEAGGSLTLEQAVQEALALTPGSLSQ